MSRNRRFKHACYIPFSITNPIPEKAQYQALKMLKFKFITNEQFNMIKEYLDRQPIWLRSSLAYETKIPRQKLKIILPSLAYYFTTGPWRLMWVRFGYDPRKDFTSRYYQTLDYRIRSNTLKEKVTQNAFNAIFLFKKNWCVEFHRSLAAEKVKRMLKILIHILKLIACPKHDSHFIG